MFRQVVSRISVAHPPPPLDLTLLTHSKGACPDLFLHHKMLYRVQIDSSLSPRDRHLGKLSIQHEMPPTAAA